MTHGFKRALSRFMDGKILTRKIRDEDRWKLLTQSNRFEVTAYLRGFGEKIKKTKAIIDLDDHGFS